MKYTLKFISTYTRRTVNQVFFFTVIQLLNLVKGPSKEILTLQFFFPDSIQDLIDSLESKINLWYLDDGNLSDDYRIVLKDLKKVVEAEKTLGLKIKPTKCEMIFPGDITEKRQSTVLTSFQKLCPGIKTPRKMNLSFFVHRSAADLLEKKIDELENVNGIVEKLDAHYVFFVEKLLQSAKVVVLLENHYMF